MYFQNFRMESLENLLTKLSFEMACYGIVQDILSLHLMKENSENLLLALLDIDSSDTDSLDLEILLIRMISDLDDEVSLMEKITNIFNVLISTPDIVLREAFKNPREIVWLILVAGNCPRLLASKKK